MATLKTAERRVEKWMTPPAIAGIPGDDHVVYRAMVDSLVGVMNAVGPTDAMTGITALTKTLALMFAATLRLDDDAAVSKLCLGQAAWLENEVMALRRAVSPTKRKGN